VSNNIIPITTAQRARALDQFLPERMFAADAQHTAGATPIDPSEVHLEPIVPRRASVQSIARPPVVPPSSQVQPWPMLAAAMVAIGVSLLAFAAFARFGHL
jgi:hypothetical protein